MAAVARAWMTPEASGFDHLFLAEYPRVVGIARRILGDSQEAEDVAQEAFCDYSLLLLLMFMFSFVLALGAAFVGAPSIHNDVESGVMLAFLPRPVRRSEIVLVKWLGLAALIALYAGISFRTLARSAA